MVNFQHLESGCLGVQLNKTCPPKTKQNNKEKYSLLSHLPHISFFLSFFLSSLSLSLNTYKSHQNNNIIQIPNLNSNLLEFIS